MRIALAVLVAFGLGLFCSALRVPIPAPPSALGVVLIAAVTGGFLAGESARAWAARTGFTVHVETKWTICESCGNGFYLHPLPDDYNCPTCRKKES